MIPRDNAFTKRIQNIFSNKKPFDRYFAIFGIIASIVLIAYLLTFNRIVYVIPGLFTLLACVIWLIIREQTRGSFNFEESKEKFSLFFILTNFLFTISILSLFIRINYYERPLAYFILTSIIAGTIACQIVYSSERQKWVILTQIIFLGVSIAWSQLLLFPTIMGSDPFFHQQFTTTLIDQSTIPSVTRYSDMPLFHLLIAITTFYTNLDYKFSSIVSVSLLQIVCNVFFVYILSYILFKNHHIGMLSALMVVLGNYHIYRTISVTPNGFGAIFVPLLLYLLIRTYYEGGKFKKNLSQPLLILIILLCVLLIHPLVSTWVAIILLFLWVLDKGHKFLFAFDNSKVPFILSLVFSTMMITFWIYITGDMKALVKLISINFDKEVFISKATIEAGEIFVKTVPLHEELFNFVGTFAFFSLSYIGLFYMISDGDKNKLIFAPVTFFPLAIGFFSLISESAVLDHRWFFLAQILLSIPLGVSIGIIYLTLNLPQRTHLLLFLVFVCFISFILIMSPEANKDNNIFSPNSVYRPALIESEIYSINRINMLYPATLGADGYFRGVLSFLSIDHKIIGIDSHLQRGIFLEGDINNFLIREDINKKGFKLYGGPYRLTYDLVKTFERDRFSKTFNSKSIAIYSNSNTTY